MKITSKFVHSGTRKFEWLECYANVGTDIVALQCYPNVGLELRFYARTEDGGDSKVCMTNEEADGLAIEILTQTARNRKNRADYEAKKAGK